jgi:hypothetical protein
LAVISQLRQPLPSTLIMFHDEDTPFTFTLLR